MPCPRLFIPGPFLRKALSLKAIALRSPAFVWLAFGVQLSPVRHHLFCRFSASVSAAVSPFVAEKSSNALLHVVGRNKHSCPFCVAFAAMGTALRSRCVQLQAAHTSVYVV